MTAWHVLFAWPTGGVWSNFVDDGVVFILGLIAGRWGLKWVHGKLSRQAARFHAERMRLAHEHQGILLAQVMSNHREHMAFLRHPDYAKPPRPTP